MKPFPNFVSPHGSTTQNIPTVNPPNQSNLKENDNETSKNDGSIKFQDKSVSFEGKGPFTIEEKHQELSKSSSVLSDDREKNAYQKYVTSKTIGTDTITNYDPKENTDYPEKNQSFSDDFDGYEQNKEKELKHLELKKKVMKMILDVEKEDNPITVADLAHYENDLDEFQEDYYNSLEAKNNKNRSFDLDLVEMTNLQKAHNYFDEFPFLNFRKNMLICKATFSRICFKIIKSWIFELVTLMVIIVNCFIMTLALAGVFPEDIIDQTDIYFLTIYTIEMFIKIMALGFILNSGSYMRDNWNLLDFLIIFTSYLPYVVDSNSNLTFLRSFRVLRPLRTISKLKKLKSLLNVIFTSIIGIKDISILMAFFFIIYGIAGLQLMKGYFKNNCLQQVTGFIQVRDDEDNPACIDDSSCPDGYFCGKIIQNPNENIMSYDTIFWSLLAILEVLTMEGWWQVEELAARTLNWWMTVFHESALVIGGLILFNIVKGIIVFYFFQRNESADDNKNMQVSYNLKRVKKIGMFKGVREKLQESLASTHQSFLDKLRNLKNSLHFINKIKKVKVVPILNVANENELAGLPDSNNKNKDTCQNLIEEKNHLVDSNKRIPVNKINPRTFKVNSKNKKLHTIKFHGMKGIIVPQSTTSDQNDDEEEKFLQTLDSKYSKEIRNSIKKPSIICLMKQKKPKLLSRQTPCIKPETFRKSLEDILDEDFEIENNVEFTPIKSGYKQDPFEIRSPISVISNEDLGARTEIKIPYEEKNEQKLNINHVRNSTNVHKKSQFFNKRHMSKWKHSFVKNNDLNEEEEEDEEELEKLKKEVFQKKLIIRVCSDKTYDLQNSSRDDVLAQRKEIEDLKKRKKLELDLQMLRCQITYKINNGIFKINNNNNNNITSFHSLTQSFVESKTNPLEVSTEIKSNFGPEKKFNYFNSSLNNYEQKAFRIPLVKNTYFNFKSEKEDQLLKRNTLLNRTAFQSNLNFSQNPYHKTTTTISGFNKKKKKSEIAFSFDEAKKLIESELLANESTNKYKPESTKTNEEIEKQENEREEKEDLKMDYEKKLYKELELKKKNEIWSGDEVLNIVISGKLSSFKRIINRINRVIVALNYTKRNYLIWERNKFLMVINSTQRLIYKLVTSPLYDRLIMLSVIGNVIVLSLNGLVDQSTLDLTEKANNDFTIIFAVDMGLKIIGIGLLDYGRDKMNIFDGAITILSMVDLNMSSGGSGLSSFRVVRVFRAFRAFRVGRLMRYFTYMRTLLRAIGKSFERMFYLIILLAIFMYIYTLMGYQIYRGNYSNPPYRNSYNQNLFTSFLCTLQLLTDWENWNNLYFDMYAANINYAITTLFLLSWGFLANFIFLNLILGILLESLAEVEAEDNEEKQNENNDKNEKNKKNESSPKIENKSPQRQKTIKDGDSSQNMTTESGCSYDQLGCQKSIYLFSKDNCFRKFSYYIINHRFFDPFIMFIILFSSLKLAIDTYYDANDPSYKPFSDDTDALLTSLFSAECALKIISYGFVLEKKSYLREYWSILDFFIVVVSIADIFLTNSNLSFVKIFRLFRVLRALRFVSHNKRMKILVISLIKCLSQVSSVLILIFLIYFVYDILGVFFLSGKMGMCTSDPITLTPNYDMNYTECITSPGNYWINKYRLNFDNIFTGFLAVYEVGSFQGWPDVMFTFQDADTPDIGADYNNSFYMGYYVIVWQFVGGIFCVNLYISVMCIEFMKAYNKERKSLLTEDQERWISIQKYIIKEKFDYGLYQIPKNKFRRFLMKIVKQKSFDAFMIFCIICNVVILAMTYDDDPNYYEVILEDLNLFFTSCFITELCIKIIALGPRGYFFTGWNRFDCFVVIVGILELILNAFVNSSLSFLRVGPQIARIFRVARVFRIVKLFKSFKNLKKLLLIIEFIMPSVSVIFALLILFYFISTVLACQLFSGIDTGIILNEFWNFDNFGNSFTTLFRASSGENWYQMMQDVSEAKNNELYVLFFCFYVFIVYYTLFNLFQLIILNEFIVNYANLDSPLQISTFHEYVDVFKESWAKYSAEQSGLKIHKKYLVRFFLELEEPLGFDLEKKLKLIEENFILLEDETTNKNNKKTKQEKESEKELKLKEKIESTRFDTKRRAAQTVMKLDLNVDENGFVYFNEFLFKILRRIYEEPLFKDGYDDVQESLLLEEEKKTLKIIRKNQTSRIRTFSSGKKKTVIVERKTANPLMELIILTMCFKSWVKFTQLHGETQFNKIISIKNEFVRKKEKIYNKSSDNNFNKIVDDIESELAISQVLSSSSSSSAEQEIDDDERERNEDMIDNFQTFQPFSKSKNGKKMGFLASNERDGDDNQKNTESQKSFSEKTNELKNENYDQSYSVEKSELEHSNKLININELV